MRISFILFLILFVTSNCFAQSKPLDFGDGSQLSLLANGQKPKDAAATGKIIRRAITVTYNGLGRATAQNPLGQFAENSATPQTIKLPKKQQNTLFGKIARSDTAYGFRQSANDFYLNGFNTVKLRQLDDCRECEVKISLVILEFKADGKFYYSPYIESIERIKNVDDNPANLSINSKRQKANVLI